MLNLDNWTAFHIYYHEDLSRAANGLVLPITLALEERGFLKRFFFVRYGLGGPHLRLRIEYMPGSKDSAYHEISRYATKFFDRHPSSSRLDENLISSTTQRLLEADPAEFDTSIYPDNSLQIMPFNPELERYGGLSLYDHSLDIFTASSLSALALTHKVAGATRSRLLTLALKTLTAQALGLTADRESLGNLLGYAEQTWGDSTQSIIEKGDRSFAANRSAYMDMLIEEVTSCGSLLSTDNKNIFAGTDLAFVASHLFLGCLSRINASERNRICVSQLHMTANRMGLSNLEEVYLARILTNVLQKTSSRSLRDYYDLKANVAPGPQELKSLLTAGFSYLRRLSSSMEEAIPSDSE